MEKWCIKIDSDNRKWIWTWSVFYLYDEWDENFEFDDFLKENREEVFNNVINMGSVLYEVKCGKKIKFKL